MNNKIKALGYYLDKNFIKLLILFLIFFSLSPYEKYFACNKVIILNYIFIFLFGFEFIIRLLTFIDKYDKFNLSKLVDIILILFDFLAIISFFPRIIVSFRLLRLFRLFRLFKLVRILKDSFLDFIYILKDSQLSEQIVFIFIASVLTIIVGGLFLNLFSGVNLIPDSKGLDDVSENFWQALLLLQDPGNFVNLDNLPKLKFTIKVIISLALSVIGLLIFSLLIGLFTNIFQLTLQFKKRKKINLEGHIVILNWNLNYLNMLNNLSFYAVKNYNIFELVLVTNHEKYFIRDKYKNLKLIFRVGDVDDEDTLKMLNLKKCNCILLLSDESDPTHVDEHLLMTLLLIRTNFPDVRILMDLSEEKNFQAALEIGGITDTKTNIQNLEIIHTEKIISSIIAFILINPEMINIFKACFSFKETIISIVDKKFQTEYSDEFMTYYRKYYIEKNLILIGYYCSEHETQKKLILNPLSLKIDKRNKIDNLVFLNRRQFKSDIFYKKNIPLNNYEGASIINICLFGWNDGIINTIYQLLYNYFDFNINIILNGISDIQVIVNKINNFFYYYKEKLIDVNNFNDICNTTITFKDYSKEFQRIKLDMPINITKSEAQININFIKADATDLFELKRINVLKNVNKVIIAHSSLSQEKSDSQNMLILTNIVNHLKKSKFKKFPNIIAVFYNKNLIEKILSYFDKVESFQKIKNYTVLIDHTYFITNFLSSIALKQNIRGVWDKLLLSVDEQILEVKNFNTNELNDKKILFIDIITAMSKKNILTIGYINNQMEVIICPDNKETIDINSIYKLVCICPRRYNRTK